MCRSCCRPVLHARVGPGVRKQTVSRRENPFQPVRELQEFVQLTIEFLQYRELGASWLIDDSFGVQRLQHITSLTEHRELRVGFRRRRGLEDLPCGLDAARLECRKRTRVTEHIIKATKAF